VDGAQARAFLVYGALSVALHVSAFEIGRIRSRPPQPIVAASAPAISGDTLDVEPMATPETDTSSVSVAVEEPGAVHAGAHARVQTSRHGAPGSSSPSEDHGALFGAVGARFATDLTTTFTRAIPLAFSADPAWMEAAFGMAGSADVTLVLNDAGHLTTRSTTGSASPALRSSMARTLALLAERTFTAGGPITRLRLTARVGRDDRHDGLHGDVFALSGGSFVGSVGSAFFALPGRDGPGRRVDIEIRLVP
jgi:hypothetical protein